MVDLSIHCCVDLRRGTARGGSLDRKVSTTSHLTIIDKQYSDQSDVTMVAQLSQQTEPERAMEPTENGTVENGNYQRKINDRYMR